MEYLTIGVEDSHEASNELSQVACSQILNANACFLCTVCLIVWSTAPARHQRFFDEGLKHRGQSVGEICVSDFTYIFQMLYEIFFLRVANACNKFIPSHVTILCALQVHCMAGVSRSASIAVFAAMWFHKVCLHEIRFVSSSAY